MSVGVGVFVVNSKNQIIVGRRMDCGLFALPGGKLEVGESVEETAKREIWEETQIDLPLEAFRTFAVLNCIRENYHWVVFSVGVCLPDEVLPVNTEPHKCESWIFVTWDELLGLELFWPLEDRLKGMQPLTYESVQSKPSIFSYS